ncbi:MULTISPECIES: DUF4328 domain-containing protein [Nostoc]|jgi:hypothetical protein|uniref:DUF4328 domain-containing protein n=1 Tax=Nostoc punctiforme FACHB-252 TaxID=1357509 RepID=A0ABR8HBL3_NOSPU|nr:MULTISPECIES: DUF4328 domain-containing protein [Nostoc]MBC1238188.1 DUF4328 domain-containing protein [Nostoc sp. 2RC]MBD2613202.1 DUF4328 domain-containing protein [Nostoc punctiforme FACHB-252]MBL1201205.1 DUF4328 domain-containing protein [Nostoc sp. GBBB01]MDZ8014918.1 DUF4328 domain-containing protein [Nostoc sp. ZfuVER08]
MNNLNDAESLKSAGVGRLLVRLLWVLLGVGLVSTLFSLLQVIAQPLYQLLAFLDGLVSIISLILGVTSVIVFLIWLHRLHADLKNLFQEYPISPGGAIARFLIPIYSLWGIANTLSTFADRFKGEGGDLTSLSEKVRSLIAPLYGLMIGSNTVGRIAFTEAAKNPNDKFLPVWFLLSCILDVGLTAILLQLAKTMRTAITQKAKRAIS